MRVKIGDTWHDGNEQPVMVELSDADKKNIVNMLPECTKYCQWPGGTMTEEQVYDFMEVPAEERG